MTKKDAIKAMDNGVTVSHANFSRDEWVKRTCHLFEFEDGILCTEREFWQWRSDGSWDTGWSLV